MKPLLIPIVLVALITNTHALQISEIVSNPVGSDSGREWFEIYNDGASPVDLSTLTISVKGGTPVPATSVSGGTSLLPSDYAVIGATVGGATHFPDDHPNFTKPLLKANITLANSGTLSLQILVGGEVMDTLSSYSAAKEGKSYAKINGVFQIGNPTPGEANVPAPIEEKNSPSVTSGDSIPTGLSGSSFISSTASQGVVTSTIGGVLTDITVNLPKEQLVVSGAETEFAVKSVNKGGKGNEPITYTWAFGDGGQGSGTTTKYTYAYTGRYLATVEANYGTVTGTGRMVVKVVSPDISITNAGKDAHGNYIDITNPNAYELNLSQWKLVFGAASFPFPKNTVLAASSTTRFSGPAMGFNSITLTDGMIIKILFPHMEEVTRYIYDASSLEVMLAPTAQPLVLRPITQNGVQKLQPRNVLATMKKQAPHASTSSQATTTPPASKKDTRLAAWMKRLLQK